MGDNKTDGSRRKEGGMSIQMKIPQHLRYQLYLPEIYIYLYNSNQFPVLFYTKIAGYLDI